MTDTSEQLFPVLVVTEARGLACRRVPLRQGIPLPRGQCFSHTELRLVDGGGNCLPADISATSLWPDNSLQWIVIDTVVDLPANGSLALGLSRGGPSRPREVTDTVHVDEHPERLVIHTGLGRVSIDTRQLRLPDFPDLGASGCCEFAVDDVPRTGVVDRYHYRISAAADETLGVNVRLIGRLQTPGESGSDRQLRFDCQLQISAEGQRLNGRLRIHNPVAAMHSGGLWDLGDPNARYLNALTLRLIWPSTESDGGCCQLAPGAPAQTFTQRVAITQHASGGPNWDSPVHVDRSGGIPLTEPGYTLELDEQEQRGKRASPALQVGIARVAVSARIDDFWQRFPSRLSADRNALELGLLPAVPSAQELQPGESCTTRFRLHIAPEQGATQSPCEVFPELRVILDAEHIDRCALPELGSRLSIDQRLQALVKEGIAGTDSFFDKRETIDEYGWRHFGDLYADHEADGYGGKRLFVSHYNNQYDPLFGFLRLYLLEGDGTWRQLADDLAHHIRDIDIYQTDADRPEYNRGLFWHTDHYLPAETATHRAYSRHQTSGAYEGHAHGGGPGGQHCYTTGLLYHYLLTGDDASRDGLLGLKDWVTRVYEGAGHLTDLPLALRNRHRPDLKNHLTGRYPLDRGTANYLQALMDSHALDRKTSTLLQIESVIRHTVHPGDDISTRCLHEVEERWHYVVFLQALCRYLQHRAEAGATESAAFLYARDSLLHYADWMVDHEAPYLDKPDILEFPNHTWAAQDLRKANVLFAAAHWSADASDSYRRKAEAFVEYVVTTLSTSPTRHYTRIRALLMQNLYPSRAIESQELTIPPRGTHGTPPAVGPAGQTLNLLRLALRPLQPLRPAEEIAAFRQLLAARSGG